MSERWHAEPVARLRRYLTAQGRWNDQQEHDVVTRCEARVESAVRAYLEQSPQPPRAMFEHLHAVLPRALEEQAEHCASRTPATDTRQ